MKTLAMFLLFTTPSFANDHGMFMEYGLGQTTCKELTSKQFTNELGDLMISAYIGGFLTAANVIATGRFDVVNGKGVTVIMESFKEWCKKNPTKHGSEAMIGVVSDILEQ